MNTLERLWRRMFRQWYNKTPGVGNSEEAQKAIRRSDAAIKSVRAEKEKIDPDIEYLKNTVHSNHFRLKVETAWRRRPTS